jgi:uncharacterized protein
MAAFTPGNIVVYRVGNGSAALTSAATAVFLDEYTPGGVLVQSIPLPTADSGANQTLTASGTQLEGLLTRSVDGRYLLLTGYDALPGTTGVAGTTAAAANRIVGRVGADGLVDTTTSLGSFASGGNIRTVASADGTGVYVAASNGIGYTTFGSTATPTILATTNTRQLEIFGNQLYYSTGSGTTGIYSLGTGLPTTAGQVGTIIAADANPNGFIFADLSAAVPGVDTLYIADGTGANGLAKFSLVGGIWTFNSRITTATPLAGGAAVGISGLAGITATVSGTTVTLFENNATSLFSLVDTAGYNAAFSTTVLTTIATAGTNTAFRGVAFAPQNALPTLTISDPTVVEGNSGTTTLVYTVTSSALAGAGGITFSFATADGTATAGSDYVSQSGTGTIAAGSNSTTITVVVNGDTVIEANETVLVNLSSPTGATIADAQGVGTITNDDIATPGTLAIGNVTLAEGNAGTTAFTFTVTRSGGSSGTVTVDYATSLGAASATNADGADLAVASGTLTFLDGETSKTITVQVNGDTAFESDEAFSVVLSNATGGGSITTATGTGTITNDDAAIPGTLAIGNVTLAEGNAGTTAFTFTVTRSGGSDGTVTVDYATTLGTADAGDLTAAGGTLTFLNGETTKTITVLVNGDYVLEADETFSVGLSNATGGATITNATGNGVITNDDVAAAVVTIDDVSVAEGNAGGTNVLTFIVTRSTNDGTFSIDYASANGTASSGDYTPASGTLTFTAGGALIQTVTVPVTGDVIFEGNETVLINLSNLVSSVGVATIGDAQGVGTINNDDPLPALSIGNATVIEGDAGTVTLVYTITADGVAPAGGIGFSIATSDGTATSGSDYVGQSTTGTIAAGATSTTFSVVVNGDTVFERDETVLVTLSNPTNATIAVAQGTGTISNDDAIPASARIFSESFTGFTAAGFASAPAAGQLDSDIWRVVGLSDSPAPSYGFSGPAGGDFGRGIITGAADPATAGVYSPSADAALILQPTGAELEANGFIEARIQNVSGATATSFDVAFDWAYRNSAARGENMQLSYSTDGVSFTVVTAASFTTPTTATAPVPSVFTNQHEAVTLSNLVVGDQGYLYLRWTHVSSTGSGSRDEVGIDNLTVDANLSSIVTANAANVSFNEGNAGTTNAVFTITRSNGAGSASVSYATANGTAIAGVDYVATSGTVTFAPGETARTVTVLVNGDTANEANETFFLNLSNPVGVALPAPQSIATILNDDNGPVAIYDIQGVGHRSPFNGLVVTTSGIVTAVDTNGFYLQDPTGDGNIATSDGILVFTSSAPTVTVGQAITITATVNEFTGSAAGSLSLTQLISPTSIVVNSNSNPLPAPVLISTDGTPGSRTPPTSIIENDGFTSFDPVTDGIDFWESLEGMRVTIQAPIVVNNTNSFGETYVVASGGAGATGINDRGGITISAGDFNPERIQIDDDSGIFAGYTPGHTQSDRLGDVTGIVNYAFAEYEVVVTQAVTVTTDNTLTRETTNLVGDAWNVTYASFNLENFDPTDPASKVSLLASEIVNGLRSPDIIGAQEIQDADGAGTGSNLSGAVTAQLLIDAIAALGGPTYRYIEIAPTVANSTGGEPNGNIRNGFFYNTARVTYVEGSAALIDTSAYTGSRRPLVADFIFNGQRITAIDLHSTSRGGSDPLWGAIQPPNDAGDSARTAQANGVRAYIDAALALDPARQFVVNGDFNGFYFETALTNLTAGGVIANLYDTLPVQERYSYIFGGNYQTLDHILVSGSLLAGATLDIVHQNAFLDAAQQATDHDQPLARIQLASNTPTPFNDVITGTSGDDIYDLSQGGIDRVVGTSGSDSYLLGAALTAADSIDGGSGGDRVTLSGDYSAGLVLSATTITNVEAVTVLADFSYNLTLNDATVAAGRSFAVLGDTLAAGQSLRVDGSAETDGRLALVGGAGDDFLIGGLGADSFVGGAGNDMLTGGAGALNELLGGLGNDIYIVSNNGDTVLELAGEGTDEIRTALTYYRLGNNVENLSFTGVGAFSGAGNDLNNIIMDTAGTPHELVGGLGDDTYVVAAVGDTIVELINEGIDAVQTGLSSFVLADNIENLLFLGASAHSGTGNALDNSLSLGAGFGALIGGGGNDTLIAGAGGASELIGGTGDDTYVVTTRADTIIELGGEGTDTVRTTTSAYVLASNVENLIFTGTGAFNGLGNASANAITGGAGDDFLFGFGGSDMLIGGDGADFLYGGDGSDTLTGGAGADTFLLFGNETGIDTITDFVSGSDRILLNNPSFNPLSGRYADIIIGSGALAPTTADGTFIFHTDTGVLSWDADGNGAGAAVDIASFGPGLVPVATDFVIFG